MITNSKDQILTGEWWVCSPFSGSSGVFYGDEEFVKNTINSGNSCAYDANGNRLYDSDSNIWGINYNLLNLPDAMQFYQGHQTIYTYSAAGAKLKVVDKTAPEGVILPVTSLNTVLSNPSVSTITTTDYVGNVIYENGTLKRILTPEGYWQDGTYYYFLKDHLGSNRVVINNSGGIAETSSYYPSGMRFGESAVNGGSVQPYRHTGHEMQSMHGLNWIDNGARFRTVNDGGGLPTVDPLAEKYYSISPYAYCKGNPMRFIDPTGMLVDDYFNENGDYLGKDEAKTDNVKIVSQKSWDDTKKVNSDGTETIDHATGYAISIDNSAANLSTDAELSVYDHYNSTNQTLTAATNETGDGGAAFCYTREKGVIITRIELNLEGNKSLGISDHANEIKNTFAHEAKHEDDFNQLGFDGYRDMPEIYKESRAVQTQMNDFTFPLMRPLIQQKKIEYGVSKGMLLPIKIPIQGI